ncbi:MAG: type I-E CRISPR-associated protein Cas7/Cse4/CasC [Anaerolineales bacterium]
MFIELHILQSFAPSNLNRDDTNNPKDTEFGGVRRARISSQAIKRAIRQEPIFAETTRVANGVRTRYMAREISRLLVEVAKKPKEETETISRAFVEAYLGAMDKKKPDESEILVYLSAEELQEVVNTIVAEWDSLAEGKDGVAKKFADQMVKKLGEVTSAPDIAMFGRMLARKPTTVILDAACQVAHAISTHRVDMDFDFFTAVDDLQQDEETGAAMMGVTAFNSACFYRYHRIDWGQLVQNLEGDAGLAQRTVEGFLRSAARAVPSGKQNSFAAQNPPSFLLAVTRQDGQSWSLVNAFEKPVRPEREGGLLFPSIQALDKYWSRLNTAYGNGEQTIPVALAIDEDAPLNNLKDSRVASLEAWVAAVLKTLPKE